MDLFTTSLKLAGADVPTDRVIDGVDNRLLAVEFSVDFGDRRGAVPQDDPGNVQTEFFAQPGRGAVAKLVGMRGSMPKFCTHV